MISVPSGAIRLMIKFESKSWSSERFTFRSLTFAPGALMVIVDVVTSSAVPAPPVPLDGIGRLIWLPLARNC